MGGEESFNQKKKKKKLTPDHYSLSLSSRECGGHAGEAAELVMEFVLGDVQLPLRRLPTSLVQKAERIFFNWKTPIRVNNKTTGSENNLASVPRAKSSRKISFCLSTHTNKQTNHR